MSFREKMHPRYSHMDLEVARKLQEMGLNISLNEWFQLKLPPSNPFYPERTEVQTNPDVYLLDHDVAIYHDGKKVHLKRKEKDMFLRQLLKEQYPVREVLPFEYERYSKRERDRIVGEIKAFLEMETQK